MEYAATFYDPPSTLMPLLKLFWAHRAGSRERACRAGNKLHSGLHNTDVFSPPMYVRNVQTFLSSITHSLILPKRIFMFQRLSNSLPCSQLCNFTYYIMNRWLIKFHDIVIVKHLWWWRKTLLKYLQKSQKCMSFASRHILRKKMQHMLRLFDWCTHHKALNQRTSEVQSRIPDALHNTGVPNIMHSGSKATTYLPNFRENSNWIGTFRISNETRSLKHSSCVNFEAVIFLMQNPLPLPCFHLFKVNRVQIRDIKVVFQYVSRDVESAGVH